MGSMRLRSALPQAASRIAKDCIEAACMSCSIRRPGDLAETRSDRAFASARCTWLPCHARLPAVIESARILWQARALDVGCLA